jgi:NAD(P)-dependent dehydrogenase (short-subunit alcohol dehydrogenase family)
VTRIALVTGGNDGIGFEVVRALAQRGMTVHLGSRDPAKGAEAAARLAGEGDIRPVELDLTREATLTAAVAAIEAAHGRLDVLVNNAGAAFPGTVLDATPETIRESFEINLHGPMRLAQLAAPLLRRGEAPRIVNVSSGAGTFGFMASFDPAQVPYAYSTAKAALNAATVILAAALRPDGIKVNAANPGLVNTKLSRFAGRRIPADGARIIVELATLDDDGPTGGFFDEKGPAAW